MFCTTISHTGGLTNMKTRSLQSKLFIAYLGMACLILFSFAIILLCFCIRAAEEKPDQCHEHLKFHISVPGRLCNPES